jgi:hypothetical protein
MFFKIRPCLSNIFPCVCTEVGNSGKLRWQINKTCAILLTAGHQQIRKTGQQKKDSASKKNVAARRGATIFHLKKNKGSCIATI